MTVSNDRFRDVLGCLAGGVCIVTTRGPDGRPRGLTATSVCSASLDPPLVLACLGAGSATCEAIGASGVFAVNFLDAGDVSLADRFASDDEEKFGALPARMDVTGAPVLQGTIGYCDCVVVERVPAGDHTVFIGRVEAAEVSGSSTEPTHPLLRYRGAYRTVRPLSQDGEPASIPNRANSG